jgi:unsaturated chondroitin disaccharide hydrolase
VYTYTNNPIDLAVARRNADHFLDRLPDTFITPWDFDVPEGPHRIADSSAAAIAASGLWNLAELTGSERYRHASLKLLDVLLTDEFMAWSTPRWEGVLKHGVYHFHKKLGVDESVMWGDFFLLEAVDKVLRSLD